MQSHQSHPLVMQLERDWINTFKSGNQHIKKLQALADSANAHDKETFTSKIKVIKSVDTFAELLDATENVDIESHKDEPVIRYIGARGIKAVAWAISFWLPECDYLLTERYLREDILKQQAAFLNAQRDWVETLKRDNVNIAKMQKIADSANEPRFNDVLKEIRAADSIEALLIATKHADMESNQDDPAVKYMGPTGIKTIIKGIAFFVPSQANEADFILNLRDLRESILNTKVFFTNEANENNHSTSMTRLTKHS